MEYISKSEKETRKIAAKVALKSKPGDVFALCGDLGAGKTAFAKGFASVFNIKKEITSPTFVIMKQYPIKNKVKIDFLIHIDCYRFENSLDAESIGLKEILNRGDIVTLIEWPEKIVSLLPKRTKKIKFEYLDQNKRKIIIKN